MIISSHKLLFVHIPKTGGQSVIEFLLKNITNNHDIDDNIEYGLKLNKSLELPGPSHYHHLFLSEYLENKILPTEDIENFYTFTVLRDPYSRFVSAYNFQELYTQYTSMYEFVKQLPKMNNKNHKLYRMFCTQSEYVMPYNQINTYYNILNIEKVFADLKLRYNFVGESIHRNQSITKIDLDDNTAKFIEDFYAQDFELIKETQ